MIIIAIKCIQNSFIESNMSNSPTDRVHGELLREWRVSQHWDVTRLAIQSNLSVAQITELETGGCAHFYTPAIKESAARKVARLLGGDPALALRPLESASTWNEPVGIQVATPLIRPSVTSTRSLSVFFRQPGWIAAPILVVMAVVTASGWLQQKWQEGGAQQFWREAYRSPGLPGAETTSAEPSPPATPGGILPAPVAQAPEADSVVPSLVQAARPSAVAETAPNKAVADALCRPVEPGAVLAPSQPRKPGDRVHIVAQKEGAVCVVDATGTSTLLALKTHETRSVYGPAPWRVHFELPEQAQLYFQGVRLRLPQNQVTNLALEESQLSP
jgi:hypothetical protein